MATEASDIERIVREIRMLSQENRIRLIGHIVDTVLSPSSAATKRQIIHGEFYGPHLSSEEDFQVAEWHPKAEDLDGP